jgi:hypothetical protein
MADITLRWSYQVVRRLCYDCWQWERCGREDAMHECMYKPWTGMGRVDGRLQHSLTAMMASRIKIRIHFVARAKRVEMLGGRRREHHHHRARSFIGLALVAVFGAWHVSVISRTPPAACRLIFPNTRLIITHPPPALPLPLLKDKEHHLLPCSALPCPVLHYYRPLYCLTCPQKPSVGPDA